MPHKSFKTELNPNNKQITLFKQYAGTARFVYNWALDLLQKDYESEKKIKPSAMTLHKILIGKKKDEFKWMREISKWCPQNSLRNLEVAYNNFFKKKNKFPKFKKKGQKDFFTLDNPISVKNNKIKLPKIGWVPLKEKDYIPEGKPKSVTISCKVNKWFISVYYEVEFKKQDYIEDVIGVDLGVKSLAITSDGEFFSPSKKLKHKEKSLKRLQRKLSRQKKGSKSRDKTKNKIAKKHFKISNHRKDILHKATSYLVKTKLSKTIVIEDLNVSGMIKNHKLAKAISNIGFYEFRRQLEYKCSWYGKELIIADRFYPSSKLCSFCGCKKEDLKLADRIYSCNNCKGLIDRDLNAAINLKKYTARYAGINAGGDDKVHDNVNYQVVVNETRIKSRVYKK
jgi:putative transposase